MDETTGHSGPFREEFDEWIEKSRRRKRRRMAAYRRAIRQLKGIEAEFGHPTGMLVHPLVRLTDTLSDNRPAGVKTGKRYPVRTK